MDTPWVDVGSSLEDRRLIEAGFPCHQVGAETRRERDTGQQPPTSKLHVWWARRPLTPSRAAIVASLDPADTDPETFIRQLGIERVQTLVHGQPWTLTGNLLERVEQRSGVEVLPVDKVVLRAFAKEQERRAENRALIARLKAGDERLASDPVLVRWEAESGALPDLELMDSELVVRRVSGDPAWFNDLMRLAQAHGVRVPNLYGYDRAYANPIEPRSSGLTVLDPTAGGGSIPFEALRLGHNVIANELNPVATVILHATLDYPARFGVSLADDIQRYGEQLLAVLDRELPDVFLAEGPLPADQAIDLRRHLAKCPEHFDAFNQENATSYLYVRQVTCPHCQGEAPLLNTHWLSKEAADPWGVRMIADHGKVRFETYRISKGRGPNGEDPDAATVTRGKGQCVHCKQAIDGDEIKAQAKGESPRGKWTDRLYTVVAVRLEPKLDKHGKPQRYTSGERAGEIKTRKVRYFRAPNERDLAALAAAERRLGERWDAWEEADLIPTESIDKISNYDRGHRMYGENCWADMFTPRQLLGHVSLVEQLDRLKPEILSALGEERGRAVVTYLQFAIDKGVDYNSRHTRWEYTRGIIKGTFGRHNYAIQWSFGEMVFSGPNSGAAWGLSQAIDAFNSLAKLAEPLHEARNGQIPITITSGTAANLETVPDGFVDLICMDPPYYDNVQYAELADFYYVWQKRTLKDLYPKLFRRQLTNKQDEAVANPARDGGSKSAMHAYENHMRDIFAECRRVLKDTGVLTLMFNHKTQEAWQTLTRSLIESGWIITASIPVESESGDSMHQKDVAAAATSIFITCRKRTEDSPFPALWAPAGDRGVRDEVQDAVRQALTDFAPLNLNPVDRMVACFGRALAVISRQWPVMEGNENISPTKAMTEASRVVAEAEVARITDQRLKVNDLDTETRFALLAYSLWGHTPFDYDDALQLSRSLGISLTTRSGNYTVQEGSVGIGDAATAARGSRSRAASSDGGAEVSGTAAPFARKGSTLTLVPPAGRDPRRLARPQTDWDRLQGVIEEYRRHDEVLARSYLDTHAADRRTRMLDLLHVWLAETRDAGTRKQGENLQYSLTLSDS